MQLKKLHLETGSSHLELVTATLLLVVPLPLSYELFQIQSNQLLAESIARHALRGAVLEGRSIPEYQLTAERISREIQATWASKPFADLKLQCEASCQKGSVLSLSVAIGTSTAVQSQVLDR